jgi:ABC-2 type transport system ATP-binding protein
MAVQQELSPTTDIRAPNVRAVDSGVGHLTGSMTTHIVWTTSFLSDAFILKSGGGEVKKKMPAKRSQRENSHARRHKWTIGYTESMTPAIQTRGLRKLYGQKAAVDGLDLTVPQGSFFGFLGPNGAGKTTTIHILIGLIPPTSGEVEILGLPLENDLQQVKRLIGIVPDESVLFDRLTGLEFLQFVGRMYGLGRDVAMERARELLELFELHQQPRKLISEYSKGMKKRAALAAALIHRPQLFLLDEPFEGVDPMGARLMKEILLNQVRQGATIFLTSHVLEVVERLCDRVAIINEGRIVIEGSMNELRSGQVTLEDTFVRVVGGEKAPQVLDWL